jgi:misacylated tRNA(Ala) deacylase
MTMPVDSLARMHSAEHVLNAVMERDFSSGRSVEAHFGSKKSKCDYRVDHALSPDELAALEAAVNAEILADHPVGTFEVSREEANEAYNMGKVPDGAQRIRIVQIGDLDAIPCIGKHVEHTRQIGRVVIRSTEMRDESILRIRFALESL